MTGHSEGRMHLLAARLAAANQCASHPFLVPDVGLTKITPAL
jgi:hypothetical protein